MWQKIKSKFSSSNKDKKDEIIQEEHDISEVSPEIAQIYKEHFNPQEKIKLTDDQINFFKAINDKDMDYIYGFLSKYKIRINFVDDNKNTPLHYAVANGNIEITDLLIRHHARLDNKNADGRTPLILAAYKSAEFEDTTQKFKLYLDLMEKLLKIGAESSSRDKDGKRFVDYIPTNLREKYFRMAGIVDNPFRAGRR